jgi:putative polyhydroxyalkanoate system protein
MANVHIEREHGLGLDAARKIAMTWAEHVEQEFSMECTYEEGDAADEVTFTRSGVNGSLHVGPSQFVLDAKLGFLLGAFKDRIEAEIVKNLDTLLSQQGSKAKPQKK